MIKNQLFIAAALFVGVAIGYIMKPDPVVEETEDEGYVAAPQRVDEVDEAVIRTLRARIAKLEKLLAAKGAEKPIVQRVEVKPVEESRGDRRTEQRMEMRERIKEIREWREKLKKEDPEEYARREKEIAQFRQRRLDRMNQKLEFLSSIDTSGMTDAQKRAHEKYQDLIARREQLEEKIHNPETTDEDREDIGREMHETVRAMREAANIERKTLVEQMTKALGYTGDAATAFGSTISDIISSTEVGFGPPHGGPGGPR